MIQTVSIDGKEGYVFKGLIRETYAFVPQEFVSFNGMKPVLDQVAYVKSGWDVRNMRFNETETSGSRLFPEVRDDLADLSEERVQHFVLRMREAYAKQ